MKRYLFYFMALCLAMCQFSCSDDDDDSSADISGSYSSSTLSLNYNGQAKKGATVVLATSSASSARAVLNGVVAGADSLTVDMTLARTKADASSAVALQGSATVDTRTVSVSGNVASGLMTLDVNVVDASPMVGTWVMAPVSSTGGCMTLNLKSADGTVTFNGQKVGDTQFSYLVSNLGTASLSSSVSSINLLQNGNVVINVVKAGTVVPLAGLFTFYVKGYFLYFVPDAANIVTLAMQLQSTKADDLLDSLEALVEMSKTGIPLICVPGADGKSCGLSMNLQMAQVMIPKLAPLLKVLPMMPALADKADLFTQIGSIMTTIYTAKEFNLTLKMVKQ